jgi:hypothetical protein
MSTQRFPTFPCAATALSRQHQSCGLHGMCIMNVDITH